MLDVDDNLLARAHYRTEDPELWLLTGLRHAAAVTVPNPRLALMLEKYSGLPLTGRSFVAPNALPFGKPRSPASLTQPSQIIWIQSDIAALTNSREAVVRAVEEFSVKHRLPVVLIGKNVLERPQFSNQVVMGQIDFQSNLQLLAAAPSSIGVAPLETDSDAETLDFVSGKSDLKILLFSGYGHAGVFSASPPYTDSPLRECAAITGNSYQGWAASLAHAFREGWRAGADHAAHVQQERNIDRVARESWAPALQACVLPRPVRGADLYEMVRSFQTMDRGPARSLGYLIANPDVGRGYLTAENDTWDHYAAHGKAEARSLRHEAAAHHQLLDTLSRESEELFQRADSKLGQFTQAQEEARTSALRHEIQSLQSRVKELRASYSWKITAPIRVLMKPVMERMARPR